MKVIVIQKKLLDNIIKNIYSENIEVEKFIKDIKSYKSFEKNYFELEKKVIECFFLKNLVKKTFLKMIKQ